MKSTVEYLEITFNSLTLKPSHFAQCKMGRFYDIADYYRTAIAMHVTLLGPTEIAKLYSYNTTKRLYFQSNF